MDEKEKNEATEPIETTETGDTSPQPPLSFTDDPEIAAFIELKVQEGIQKALQGKPPKANTTDPTEQERRSFEKMTYKERLTLFNSNPHTYNKLSKGSN